MNSGSHNLLLVEDDPDDAQLIRAYLDEVSTFHYTLKWAKNLDYGLNAVNREDFEVILVDLTLPDSDPLNTIQNFIAQTPHVPIIVITGRDDSFSVNLAIQAGAEDYLLKKDITGPLLVKSIFYARERHQFKTAIQENETNLRAMLDAIPESALLINTKGQILSVNATMAFRYQLNVKEVIDANLYDILSPEVRESRQQKIEEADSNKAKCQI